MESNGIVKRHFHPGDEWSYYKIYTGTQTADTIITELLLPLATGLQNQKIINNWFFIRYKDQDGWHLRFRLHHRPEDTGKVLQSFRMAAQPFLELKMIWKIQLETYTREIERYGSVTMDLSERYFHSNSIMTAFALKEFSSDDREDHRWLFSLACIDATLTFFQYDLKGKYTLLKNMKESFAKEFGMNKSLKVQLDQKYRRYREHIAQIMYYSKGSVSNLLDEIGSALIALENHSIEMLSFSHELKNLKDSGKIRYPKENLMYSYVHMLMNRLLKSKQRIHEMVAYDMLYRHYRSTIAQKENQLKEMAKPEKPIIE